MNADLANRLISDLENRLPSSWYYLAPVWSGSQIKKFKISDIEIMVYKAQANPGWIALSARCLHMNADLSCGHRKGDAVQCRMHQWVYDTDGEAKGNTASNQKLKKYEVIESHGNLFVFLGDHGSFPFPLKNRKNISISQPFQSVANVPMFLQAANGFDTSHFQLVHGRHIEKILEQASEPDSTSITYQLKNISEHWRDRLLRRFFNSKVILKFSVYGGNIVFAEVSVGKRSYDLLTFLEPVTSGSAKAVMFSILPKKNWILNRIQHRVLKYLILQFFNHEIEMLDGIRLTPESLATSHDPVFTEFLSWYQERLIYRNSSYE